MNKKAKKESTDVGKRINDTKREIAQLNEELEKLIKSNVKKHQPLVEEHKIYLEKSEMISTVLNKSDISMKAPKKAPKVSDDGSIIKYSKPRISAIDFAKNMENLESLCKKNKSYDKKATKEFIRQQKEKRGEEKKKLNSRSKIDQELKRQKLYDLHHKSLALVQRNVQLKQVREKSRENHLQIRMDKSSYNVPKKLDKETPSSATHYHQVNNTYKFRFQNDKLKTIQTKIDTGKCNKSNALPIKSKDETNEYFKTNNSKMRQFINPEITLLKYVPSRNITVRSDCLPYADQDLAATKIQAYYRGYRLRKTMKHKVKSKSEHYMLNADRAKQSKETQTNVQQQKIETPVWLQPSSIDPYPCNFINTVKRKLQFVVNSVNSRDIGTQSSIISTCDHLVKSQNESEKHVQHGASSMKDDMISFHSHKGSNLDANALQHLVLVHNGKKNQQNFNGPTESESDTSKNIPEISSESISLPIPNDETVSVSPENRNILVINTDRIKDLHLMDPAIKNITSSQNFNEMLGNSVDLDKSMSKKSYTFNFHDDEPKTNDMVDSSRQEGNMDQKFVKSPRDSIISFNRSHYGNSLHDKISNDSSRLSLGSNQNGKFQKKHCRATRSILSLNICRDGQRNNTNITKSNFSEKYDKSSSKIIENIENSINTSLISHISDNRSDSSCVSSHLTRQGIAPSTCKSFVMKEYTSVLGTEKATPAIIKHHFLEPIFNSIDPKSHWHWDVVNEPANSIENTSNHQRLNNSLSTSAVNNRTNPIHEERNRIIPKHLKMNDDSKSFNTEELSDMLSTCSSLTDKNSKHNTGVKESVNSTEQPGSNFTIEKKNCQEEVPEKTSGSMSSYSSNFSFEKTHSLKKAFPSEISVGNKFTKPKRNQSKNEINHRKDELNLGNDIVNNLNNEIESDTHIVKNISSQIFHSKGDTNKIHLKFEAEVHLLNDFNESLKQFMAVEKAFDTIKSKNDGSCMKFPGRSSSISKEVPFPKHSNISFNLSKSIISSVNVSRGSEIDDSDFSNHSLLRTPWKSPDNSIELEISNVEENIEKANVTVREKLPNNLAGLSIKMFEQLIKDEDVRIENLKTIIKIREQALLDRTKGELAWLEIQRKHLKETGNLYEASLVKKKQRGILLKHQQERREMQRLKQLQKIQSNERKTILKEQRNLIKAKLTSEKIMSELKIHTPRRRQSNGPMKVLKTSGSVHSETSRSKGTSGVEELLNITSRSQSIQLSEVESSRKLVMNKDETNIRMIGDNKNLSNMKEALLIRQTALMERRKAVEDLLYRHQKLLEEEKKIEELEMTANAIIMQMPTINQSKSVDANKLRIMNKQLNEFCQKKMISQNKLVDKSNCISQYPCNKLHDETANCRSKYSKDSLQQESSDSKSPIKYSTDTVNEIDECVYNVEVSKNKKSEDSHDSISKKKSLEYSEDFELDTDDIVNDVAPNANENNLSSLSELIQDFSEIEHGISMLRKQFNPCSDLVRSDNTKTVSEPINILEQSLIETNTIQNFNNSEDNDNSINLKETLLFDDDNYPEIKTVRKDFTLLEPSKYEDISETKKNIFSNIEKSLDTTEEISRNSSEIKSNKIIDVISTSEIPSQHNLSENTLNHLALGSRHESSITNKENDPGRDETSAIDSVTESEEKISQDNTLDLTTNVILEKEETVHKSFIIASEPELCSKPKNCTNCEVVTAAKNYNTDCMKDSVSSIVEVNDGMIINGNVSPRNQIGSAFNKNICEGVEILFGNTQNAKPLSEDNNFNREQSNFGLVTEEKTDKKFTNCDDKSSHLISSESYIDLQNGTKDKYCQSISSEQTIDEDIPDLNNVDHQMNTQISFTMTSNNNSFSLEKECTSEKADNNGSYTGTTKLIENEQSKSNNKTSFNSTDISEMLSTDSEHLDISEVSPGDSSDNYTDDFEDDKEGESRYHINLINDLNAGELLLPATNECGKNEVSSIDENEVKNKKIFSRKENEVIMMKIDLKTTETENEASIVVFKENTPYSQEINCNNDESETINPICIPRIEFTSALEDLKKTEVRDTSVLEQQSDLKTTESRGDHLEFHTINEWDRVSEISLNKVDSAETTKDKDITYQDNYVTTYEDITPVNSPESVSPVKSTPLTSMNIFGSEAEELLKKQIAIEQEIKHLEQQQKEHLPFVYMREIPNKPPPPYTPPSTLSSYTPTILPSKIEDLNEICNYSAKVLYNAYLSNNLNVVTFSETDFKSINQTKSTKECCLFVFDLCREVAKNHYTQFENDNVSYWLKLPKDSRLFLGKPFDYCMLEKHINTKVKGLLKFEKENMKENSIIRWSKKKKDHVDEILALESQFEEHEWLDYEKDELMVKNEVTNEILNILLNETIEVYKKIFS